MNGVEHNAFSLCQQVRYLVSFVCNSLEIVGLTPFKVFKTLKASALLKLFSKIIVLTITIGYLFHLFFKEGVKTPDKDISLSYSSTKDFLIYLFLTNIKLIALITATYLFWAFLLEIELNYHNLNFLVSIFKESVSSLLIFYTIHFNLQMALTHFLGHYYKPYVGLYHRSSPLHSNLIWIYKIPIIFLMEELQDQTQKSTFDHFFKKILRALKLRSSSLILNQKIPLFQEFFKVFTIIITLSFIAGYLNHRLADSVKSISTSIAWTYRLGVLGVFIQTLYYSFLAQIIYKFLIHFFVKSFKLFLLIEELNLGTSFNTDAILREPFRNIL